MTIYLANLFVITNPNYVPLEIELEPLTASAALGSSVVTMQGLKEKERIK